MRVGMPTSVAAVGAGLHVDLGILLKPPPPKLAHSGEQNGPPRSQKHLWVINGSRDASLVLTVFWGRPPSALRSKQAGRSLGVDRTTQWLVWSTKLNASPKLPWNAASDPDDRRLNLVPPLDPRGGGPRRAFWTGQPGLTREAEQTFSWPPWIPPRPDPFFGFDGLQPCSGSSAKRTPAAAHDRDIQQDGAAPDFSRTLLV